MPWATTQPRILIVYATAGSEGQTALIAQRLAGALRVGGASADVVDCAEAPPDLRLGAYDGALVGGSVRGGRYRRSLRRFLRERGAELAGTPWAFFSVCLTVVSEREGYRAAALELPRRMLEEMGLEPREVAVFGGALRFSRHGRLAGRILFAMNRRYLGETDMAHDWEYTDWGDVADFAHRFLASLASPGGRAGAGGRRVPSVEGGGAA